MSDDGGKLNTTTNELTDLNRKLFNNKEKTKETIQIFYFFPKCNILTHGGQVCIYTDE